MKKITNLALLFVVLLVACEEERLDQDLQQDKVDEESILQYLNSKQMTATRDEKSGIYYQILDAKPEGAIPAEGDIVSIYYRISLLNGLVLEVKSAQSGEPLKFKHTDNALFPEGINYGVGMMKLGEKYRFYLPSRWALGSFFASGLLEPNAVMVAEIELAKIENEEQQKTLEDQAINQYLQGKQIDDAVPFPSGIYLKTLKPGSGNRPVQNQMVTIHYTRKYLDGTVSNSTIGSEPVTFRLGSGRAVEGLEQGLKQMQFGEKALLMVPSHLGFGSSIQVFPQELRDEFVEKALNAQNIYPFATLIYEVEIMKIY